MTFKEKEKRVQIQVKDETGKSNSFTIKNIDRLDIYNKIYFLAESLAKDNDYTIIKFWKKQPKEENNEKRAEPTRDNAVE